MLYILYFYWRAPVSVVTYSNYLLVPVHVCKFKEITSTIYLGISLTRCLNVITVH